MRYLVRHVHRMRHFAWLGADGLTPLSLRDSVARRSGRVGPLSGTFQMFENRPTAFYGERNEGRIRLGDEDFLVEEVVAASLADLGQESSRLTVNLEGGREVVFEYARPEEPFSLDDWYPGRIGWDLPARMASALNNPDSRAEWARMDWLDYANR